MNDTELMVRPSGSAVVPIDYAEKAMGSLMQLHSELMEEKERRVDLYRRLMEREQAVAELRMYVKLLEEKVEKSKSAAPAAVAAPVPAPRIRVAPRPPPPPARPLTLVRSPPPPAPGPVVAQAPRYAPRPPPAPLPRPPARGFAAQDGWKAW